MLANQLAALVPVVSLSRALKMVHLTFMAMLLVLTATGCAVAPASPQGRGARRPAGSAQDVTAIERAFRAAQDEEERVGIIEDLAEKYPLAALAFLIQALDDPSVEIRKTIIENLGRQPHPRVREVLRHVIETDPDEGVVELAQAHLRAQMADELRRLLLEAEQEARKEGQPDLAREFAREAKRIARLSTGWLIPELDESPTVFTVLPEDRPARFVVIGDFGTKKYGAKDPQQIVARVMQDYHARRPWDFGLTVGDNFYPDGLETAANPRWQSGWENIYGRLGIRFYATMGNHDWRSGAEGLIEYTSSTWYMESTFYTFRAGPVQFFALDTVTLTKKPAQLAWLEKALQASRAPWKIAYGHHPLYSAGAHGGSKRQRQLLLPLFRKYGVQIYIAGHEHDMQHLNAADMHFFIVGGSGKKPRRIRPGLRSQLAVRAHGFGMFDATPTHITATLVVMPHKLDPSNPHKDVREWTCTLVQKGKRIEDNCPHE